MPKHPKSHEVVGRPKAEEKAAPAPAAPKTQEPAEVKEKAAPAPAAPKAPEPAKETEVEVTDSGEIKEKPKDEKKKPPQQATMGNIFQ